MQVFGEQAVTQLEGRTKTPSPKQSNFGSQLSIHKVYTGIVTY